MAHGPGQGWLTISFTSRHSRASDASRKGWHNALIPPVHKSWSAQPHLVMVFTDPFEDQRAAATTPKMAASVNKHYTSPFPPLQLTPASAFELETLAQKFVARSIGTYERFLIDDHGKADETRWKLLSAKDGLRAYAEQPRGNDANVSYEEETPITDLPVVMITGTMVGNLDDIMYGVICNTTELMRIKTSYIHDDLVGSCVLASLATPTPENPFNATDIKWVEVKVPLATRPIIKNRDFVYLETTGIERLRNGERVGYHYVHSVQFPETPVRDSTVRGNSSIGVIFRQRDRDVTDVFIKAYFNPAGGLVRAITLRSAARLLLSVANNAYCSNMKKLVWAIRQKYAADTSSSSSDGGVSAVATSDEKSCSGCGKKQSVFIAAASKTNRGSKMLHKRRNCKLCMRYMCLDCRRQHQLSFLQPDLRLVQHLVTVCRGCESEALAVSAFAIAREEVLLNNSQQHWFRSDTFSSVTSGSSE